jgi:hypothetical protein
VRPDARGLDWSRVVWTPARTSRNGIHNTAKETVGDRGRLSRCQGRGRLGRDPGGQLPGVGTKHVAVKWSDLKVGRDGKDLMLATNWTKDTLKAMPDYKYERRKPARAGD